MKSRYEQEKRVGIEAIIKAASLSRQVQKEMVGSGEGLLEKKDRSPVTVADYGAQAIICRSLRQAFPDEVIVAEENSSLLQLPENQALLARTTNYVERILGEKTNKVCDWIDLGNGEPNSNRFWTLDPVDGTKGFLRGNQYAVALALLINNQVQLALLACPNLSFDSPTDALGSPYVGVAEEGALGSLYVGVAGEGALGSLYVGVAGEGALMMNFDLTQTVPLQVSSTSDPSQARLIESYERRHTDHQLHQNITQSFKNKIPSIRMDGQTKYGMLARGAADVYLRLPSPKTPDYREKIWDHAAGSLIVKEAGGLVTDIHGQALDFSLGKKLTANQGVIASNGKIHQAMIEAIQKVSEG